MQRIRYVHHVCNTDDSWNATRLVNWINDRNELDTPLKTAAVGWVLARVRRTLQGSRRVAATRHVNGSTSSLRCTCSCHVGRLVIIGLARLALATRAPISVMIGSSVLSFHLLRLHRTFRWSRCRGQSLIQPVHQLRDGRGEGPSPTLR